MNTPTVLITGALTGIGRATALAFAHEGARVVVSGRHDDEGQKLASELRKLGTEAEFHRTDVRREEEVKNLVDQTIARFGGFVAQQLTLDRPKHVRRLILVGTGPRSGDGMATLTPEAKAIFGKTYAVPDELWLEVFFSPTETSQAAGQAFLQRLRARKENRDPSINEKVALAQIAALEEWGAPRSEPYAYLKNIKQPVLIINGSNDVIIYTVNSFILQRNLPNAQLIVYPDSNHGSQYQFPELFVEHVNLFLAGPSIGKSRETSTG
jgi:NAD(P)-dependent dehydrogenase (short-subunit alcohol dehydrogenase family)